MSETKTSDEQGDFEIWQFNRRGKGCLSYAILSEGDAIVVDPSRAIDVYASFLEQSGVRKVHVLDTHFHADHVSGSRWLADVELRAKGPARHVVRFDLSASCALFRHDGD